jgi:hypothetical protein
MSNSERGRLRIIGTLYIFERKGENLPVIIAIIILILLIALPLLFILLPIAIFIGLMSVLLKGLEEE